MSGICEGDIEIAGGSHGQVRYSNRLLFYHVINSGSDIIPAMELGTGHQDNRQVGIFYSFTKRQAARYAGHCKLCAVLCGENYKWTPHDSR